MLILAYMLVTMATAKLNKIIMIIFFVQVGQ